MINVELLRARREAMCQAFRSVHREEVIVFEFTGNKSKAKYG